LNTIHNQLHGEASLLRSYAIALCGNWPFSLSSSQKLATGIYSEPDASSTHPHYT